MRWLRARQPEQRRDISSFERRYSLFVRGEADSELIFEPDAIWHVPGRSQVAGTFVGEPEIRAHFQKLHALSEGTLRIELEGVSEGDHLAAWQHVTASRNGRTLDDLQCLRLRISKGRVHEAWLYPSDLQAHDEFWGGTWQPLFTPDDRGILASAFREGTQRLTAAPSGLIALLLAMAAASLAIFAYNGLHRWRRPVTATVSTQNVGALQHVTMSGAMKGLGSVSWVIDAGYVARLTVSGPEQGTVDVALPLPLSQCNDLAAAVNGVCTAEGQVSVGTPVELAWSTPEALSSTNGLRLMANSLDLATSGGAGGIHVVLYSRTSSQPSVCFSSPQTPARLAVSRGALQARYRFKGDESAVTCDAALHLAIGSAGLGQPPAIELDGIDALTLHASAPFDTLQGLTGQTVLTPGGTTVLGSPTVVALRATEGDPLAATLDIGPGRQSLVVHSRSVKSVLTDAGELVPSEWERDPGIIVPILGGFIGAFVVTPLGLAVQGLMALLKRWEHWLGFRQWRRRKRKVGGSAR
jgi:ketosteroid isomerase-like protein